MIESEVEELLGKGGESIAAAGLLLRDGYVDFSGSHAYYAMFYSLAITEVLDGFQSGAV